jgi:flagellar biosynthesis/type III secretory pathway chaperone
VDVCNKDFDFEKIKSFLQITKKIITFLMQLQKKNQKNLFVGEGKDILLPAKIFQNNSIAR